jgi:cytochrome c556
LDVTSFTRMSRIWRSAALASALVMPLLGAISLSRTLANEQPNAAEAAELRREKFSDLLAAVKAFDREAKSDSVDYAAMQDAVTHIEELSRDIPSWFPRGSGPESGAHTYAKPEIWQNWSDFRVKASATHSAAAALGASVRGRDIESVRDAERALVNTCHSCHRAYEYGNF